jgi:hypothetical protein
MKRAIVAALLALGVTAFTYEDNTHQKLTQRAIEVAISQGGLPANFFAPGEKQSIIDGAGLGPGVRGTGGPLKTDGEDYTFYDKSCDKVEPYLHSTEVFNHFVKDVWWGGACMEPLRFLLRRRGGFVEKRQSQGRRLHSRQGGTYRRGYGAAAARVRRKAYA